MAQEGYKSIGEYLLELAENPELAKAFRENPERAMVDARLEESDRDLILSGSVLQIRRRIHEDLGQVPENVEFIVWTIVWPIVFP